MRLEELREWMVQSDRTAVFTGAGVSTDSGIPDFRGRGGVYERYDPAKVFDLGYFCKDPELFYRYAREELFAFMDKKPNITHYWIGALESETRPVGVITQNIDTLHQRAGSHTVYPLHGSVEYSHCMECGKQYLWNHMRAILADHSVAQCDQCKGLIKPNIVFFGEMLPQDTFEAAWNFGNQCDLMLVMGSSLQVYPAAQIPLVAKERGAKLVIINREETPFDPIADLVIHAPLSDVSARMIGS